MANQFTRENISDILKENIATVTFTKKDGDVRVMQCTLKAELLPPVVVTEGKIERQINDAVLPVYDLNVKAWRSFRLDSVTSVLTDDEENN
jgi:hypothetical protein